MSSAQIHVGKSQNKNNHTCTHIQRTHTTKGKHTVSDLFQTSLACPCSLYYQVLVLQSTTPVLLCTTPLLLQKPTPVLLCTTPVLLQKNTPVLVQHYSVLLCTTPKYYSGTTTKYYSSTTLHCKVLVLQSTSPVLLCTSKSYKVILQHYIPYYKALPRTASTIHAGKSQKKTTTRAHISKKHTQQRENTSQRHENTPKGAKLRAHVIWTNTRRKIAEKNNHTCTHIQKTHTTKGKHIQKA